MRESGSARSLSEASGTSGGGSAGAAAGVGTSSLVSARLCTRLHRGRGGSRERFDHRGFRRSGGSGRFGLGCIAAFQEGEHVLFADPSALAGPGNGGEVYAVFPRHAPHERRTARLTADALGARPLPIDRGRRRSGGGLTAAIGLRSTGWGRFARRLLRLAGRPDFAFRRNPADDGVHHDGFALRNQDLYEMPGERRGDLGIHLVGRDVEEGIIPFDGVADRDPPLGDRPLGDALPHLGHDDVAGHESGILLRAEWRLPHPTGRCSERNSRIFSRKA